MDILELLADADTGLTVSKFRSDSSVEWRTVRIIVVLEQRQWLQKDPESSLQRVVSS
jgi:hypothetical protein